MDPVIGLDIAKGKSQVQAFLQKKDPYKKSFVFEHNVLGLHDFHLFWLEVEEITDIRRSLDLFIHRHPYERYSTIKHLKVFGRKRRKK
ncbi:hypothetical protein [Halobacillus sp. A5]|uniref:hypothetical protein n=1 Tax=Halobacillus sp. A5 TaxID=2880263 RepID=UPI003531A565